MHKDVPGVADHKVLYLGHLQSYRAEIENT